MHHFTAHRLTVRGLILEPVLLNEHKGSAVRGAICHSLRRRFCTMRDQLDCVGCPLWEACPVCTLVSTMSADNRLGRDAARPYTVQPPLDGRRILYPRGDILSFGLTLYGDSVKLFPYVFMALQGLEESGLGKRVEPSGWRRGTIRIQEIQAENPLTRASESIATSDDRTVQMPRIPITHAQVSEWASEREWPEVVHLDLLTPTRLTYRKRLVKPGRLSFVILLGRILDRLESLTGHFSDTPLQLDFRSLIQRAEAVRTASDETRWIDLRSYSTRQRRATPIGGLVGQVTFAAEDWRPFLPWLIWGQFTHVGKDAVKGNGWYRLGVYGSGM